MPAPPPSPKSPAVPAETRRSWPVLFTIALVITIPVGIVGSLHWLNSTDAWSQLREGEPKWVPSAEVRATTRDGTLVKLHVAFDAGSSATKTAVERQVRELGVLLELSISAMSARELASPGGITLLSQGMLTRVNAYLAAQGVAPLHSVAIQDLWYTRPR